MAAFKSARRPVRTFSDSYDMGACFSTKPVGETVLVSAEGSQAGDLTRSNSGVMKVKEILKRDLSDASLKRRGSGGQKTKSKNKVHRRNSAAPVLTENNHVHKKSAGPHKRPRSGSALASPYGTNPHSTPWYKTKNGRPPPKNAQSLQQNKSFCLSDNESFGKVFGSKIDNRGYLNPNLAGSRILGKSDGSMVRNISIAAISTGMVTSRSIHEEIDKIHEEVNSGKKSSSSARKELTVLESLEKHVRKQEHDNRRASKGLTALPRCESTATMGRCKSRENFLNYLNHGEMHRNRSNADFRNNHRVHSGNLLTVNAYTSPHTPSTGPRISKQAKNEKHTKPQFF